MLVAQLKYRDYVPMDVLAIEFAEVEFTGDDNVVYLLNKLAKIIKYKKFV